MFRKFVATLTLLTLIMSVILPVQLFADDGISYEGRICRDLGILKGDTGTVDSAYLATRPTRLQAAVMFLRLKGLEQKALSYTGGNHFKDSGTVAWKAGRNVLSYLKDHPELGWVGDGMNFLPSNLIDSKAYYKVLLESLGYKQKIDGEGDFDWGSVLDFAADKGLEKVAEVNSFTINSLAIATVEALKLNMKNSDEKLIEYLVNMGNVDEDDAIAAGLYSTALEAAVKTVRAISNSRVEVVFEEPVDGSRADDEDIYSIDHLDVKDVSIKNASSVILETSSMSESTTYTLEFNDENYSFKGMKKDSNAPKLITAECKDTDLVELSFDRILDIQSAQDTDTYSIAGVTVKSAELDSTNTKVRIITSGIQLGRSYELKIKNIKNGDGIVTKLITKRFTGRKDTNPPKLDKLTVLNNVRLLLEFSDINGLNKTTAQEKDNYKITSSSGDLEIESVLVKDKDGDDLWESVELVTESQSVGKTYTLRIVNITDNSVLGNEITREIKKDFRARAKDTSSPSVDRNPKAITDDIIEIIFKDANALDLESACDFDNYELDEGLEIKDIRIKDPTDLYSEGGRTVHLITNGMEKSENYTLIIKGIQDEFGNELKTSSGGEYKKYRFRGIAEDNTPPYVTFVECIDSKIIEINFDNLLDKESAEDTANYRIDGLALVTKAKLQDDEKTVRLTVSSLSSDKNHKILMNNIEDISGNSLSNISVSVVYNGNIYDTDEPEVAYIEALNEYELWVHFEEEINASSAKLKASGITFSQVGSVLDDGTTVVMKASERMDDREYEVSSLTGVRDLRNNAYVFEDGLEFYGNDEENYPPEVESWEQMDVTKFRVIFSEPILTIGVAGIKNPSGVSLSWTSDLNPEEEDTNEAYSTVDYIASKEIPPDKDYQFNFTSMVTDYMNKGAYDEDDDDGTSNSTVLESYLDDDEDPYIEYVETISRTKAQVVFNEAMKLPGSYKITYRDDDDRLKTIRIARVEVDSDDENRVNIFTEDQMTQEYSYTLIPMSAATDIAGNKLDTHDVEIDFEGSNIVSKDYILGVEFEDARSLRVIKSSKIYKVTSLYELDDDGNVIESNLMEGDSTPVYGDEHRVTSRKPLLRDVRYRITVDGLEYRFYGGVQNGDISLELPEREITFDGMDVDSYDVEVFRTDGDELDIDEENGEFIIDSSERLRNGEVIYVYVERESDEEIIYGTRIEVEGMPTASSSNKITDFRFKSLDLDAVGSINDENDTIKVAVPFGTDRRHMAATFDCSEDAVVKVEAVTQVSGQTVNDFSKEVIYTVIAEDGSKAYYTVIVTVEESKLEKKIKSFIFEDLVPDVEGIIDNTNHVINIELPSGTDLTALKPTIITSEGTTVSPESGIANDFSNTSDTIVYKVTAKDGSTQNYSVKVSVDLSSDNFIKSFKLEGVESLETNIEVGKYNSINIKIPYNKEITKLKPIIIISENAKISPESGEEKDFSKSVIYSVTAEDGKVREYTVTIDKAQSPENFITSFSFLEISTGAKVNINNDTKIIDVVVPYGTNVSNLKALFSSSAGSVVKVGENTQISGVTANDFSKSVVYAVTAENKSVREYEVRVAVEPNTMSQLLEFGFETPKVQGSIDYVTGAVNIKVPFGTKLNELKAAFKCSDNCTVMVGDSTQESGKTVNDFSSDVKYKVIAQDGTHTSYEVKVTVEAAGTADMKKMVKFKLKARGKVVRATIDEGSHRITAAFPEGTDLTNLVASFEYNGSSVYVGEVKQISGITINDFSKDVVYKVMAHNNTTIEYTVAVNILEDEE